jgi:hypothetical protein
MSTPTLPHATASLLSRICFIGGFLSIIASIAIWSFTKGQDPAHAERFGIFVGLWAPTFFILSDRFKTRLA